MRFQEASVYQSLHVPCSRKTSKFVINNTISKPIILWESQLFSQCTFFRPTCRYAKYMRHMCTCNHVEFSMNYARKGSEEGGRIATCYIFSTYTIYAVRCTFWRYIDYKYVLGVCYQIITKSGTWNEMAHIRIYTFQRYVIFREYFIQTITFTSVLSINMR